MKLSGPLKSWSGEYVTVPSPLFATVPCSPCVTALTASVSPSTSVSFVRTLTVAGVSSSVVAESSRAAGGSLTAVTVTLTVAVARCSWPRACM